MSTRLYLIESKAECVPHEQILIEATSAAQALRYATKSVFECRLVSGLEVAALVQAGVQVEKATEETAAEIGDKITVPVTAHTRVISKSITGSENLIEAAQTVDPIEIDMINTTETERA